MTRKKYERSGLKEEEANTVLEAVLDHMDQVKPYRTRGYSIHELSEDLGISRHIISQVLNQKLQKNFYAFINEYRISEFKRIHADPGYAHFTIVAMALESGFNSKTSFNMVFKKYENMTPSEYARLVETSRDS